MNAPASMRAATLLAALLAAGCAGLGARGRMATLPGPARSDPSGYVVVTVTNDVSQPAPAAASTPRGYDALGPYAAGGRALALSHALAADHHLREVASWPIAVLGVHCLVYALPPGADRDQALAELKRDSRVESAQPLLAFNTQSQEFNDPYAKLQRNVAQLDIAGAQQLASGSGVRVAVIDTGADLAHPDLPPGTLQGRNFVDADDAAFRGDTHGTAVLGVIGAVPNNHTGMVGIAPGVRLAVYKACWRESADAPGSVCNSFTLAQALAAAIDARADVINLSLGGPADPLLSRLVQQGLARGAIVVGAMPRSGRREGFPAAVDGVIVADVTGAAGDSGALRAPGSDVLSLAPQGRYDFYSGSSFAAAEVTGLVALMKSVRPQLTAQEALGSLRASEASGASGVNACRALAGLGRNLQCGGEASAVAARQ